MALVGSPGVLAPLYANQAGYNTDSTDNLLIALEVKIINISSGKAFGIGNSVKIYSAPKVWMFGEVLAHDPVVGLLTVDVTAFEGFGSYANWNISLSGPQGPRGEAGSGGGGAATGSMVVTGDATLDPTKGSVLAIPASWDCYLTLPAGTDIESTGATIFNITNGGEFDLGIKDSTGKKLGWLRAKDSSVVGCIDNTTESGVWNAGNLKVSALTAHVYFQNYATGNIIFKFDLNNNKEIIVYGTVSPRFVVYDKVLKIFINYSPVTGITKLNDAVIGASGNQVLIAGMQSDGFTVNVCSLTINADNSSVFTSTAITNPEVTYYTPTISGTVNSRFVNIMLHKVANNKFIVTYSTKETTNRIFARVLQIDPITHNFTISPSNIVLATSTVDWMYRRVFSLSDDIFVMVYSISGNVTWSSYTISGLSITTTVFETQKVATADPLSLKIFDRGSDNKIVFVCSNGATYGFGTFNIAPTGLAITAASFTATALSISSSPFTIDHMQIAANLACLMSTTTSNPFVQLINYTTGSEVAGDFVSIPANTTTAGTCILSVSPTKIRVMGYGSLANLSISGNNLTLYNMASIIYNTGNLLVVGSAVGYYGIRDSNLVFDENITYTTKGINGDDPLVGVIYGDKSIIYRDVVGSYMSSQYIKSKESPKSVWAFTPNNVLERIEFV